MKVSTVSEMRSMDKAAINQYGIPEMLLMENAGLASYAVLEQEFGIKGKAFIIFCGLGNNGGDGFVLARKVHSGGGMVKVFILGEMIRYKGSAKANLDILLKMPVEVREITSAKSVKKDIVHCDCLVDAIFGTGLARDTEGLHRDVIEEINASGKAVLSLDIPSGINGDTGHVMGSAVRADITVTFGLPKAGNLLLPGYDHCGSLFITHISFPSGLYDAPELKIEVNDPPMLPYRNPDGHKGDFGEALFIAGAKGYYGAPYFAAMSFMKAGGGYSRLAAPSFVTPFIAAKGSEIVFIPQEETTEGSISLSNKATLLDLAKKTDIIVLGPGLSLNEETAGLVRELAKKINKPLIIDGDGITAVCKDLACIRKRKSQTILTPHLGEMSRITGKPVSTIEASKVEALRSACLDLSAIIVLKGAHTLIGYPDGRIFINMSGNPGMATAGSGDVLTGTIAAMYGMGLSLEDAVRKGVFIHGASGDLAADEKGEDGITAQDILDFLPQTMMLDRENLLASRYSLSSIL
jgi:ADP-dependent NAD(P)H-hydrate dehydratase / NAD(P)H-hydrate epimerase